MNAAIRTACLCLLTAGVLWVCYDAHLALRGVQLKYMVSNLETASKSVPEATVGMASHVNGVVDNLGGVISAEREAQKKQLTETTKIIAATKEVLVRTDCALNGGPGCKGVLLQARDTIANIQEQSNTIASASQRTFDSASQTLDSLNRRIQDKRIDDIIDGFQVSQLRLNIMLANGDSITASAAHTADYWDKKLTTPPKLAKTILMEGLHLITIPLR